MDLGPERPARRRIDAVSALMSAVTLAALFGAAWVRYGPGSSPVTPVVTIGAPAPPLRLIDPETSEPIVLLGLANKVVWVVFWSAESPVGSSCLRELAAVGKTLADRRLSLITAAVDAGNPARVRAATAASGAG